MPKGIKDTLKNLGFEAKAKKSVFLELFTLRKSYCHSLPKQTSAKQVRTNCQTVKTNHLFSVLFVVSFRNSTNFTYFFKYSRKSQFFVVKKRQVCVSKQVSKNEFIDPKKPVLARRRGTVT
jgi:hypothetical protein